MFQPLAAERHQDILIIDSRVAEPEAFIAAADPGTAVYRLTPGGDALAEISAIFEGLQDLDRVHLVSHGEPGALWLGDSRLASDTLAEHSARLADWGTAFAEQGQLLLYGCEVGAGARGTAFVAALSETLGVAVAASDDITGAADQGGDWVLEYGGHDSVPLVPTDWSHTLDMTNTPVALAYPGRTSGEFSNPKAFAALRADGSVVTWGDDTYGGDSSSPTGGDLSSGVQQIFSNEYAFAALKTDGSVVTWGSADRGGNQHYYDGGDVSVADQLTSGVTRIFSTTEAFAALKSDGSVVTWGLGEAGSGETHDGNDYVSVADQLDGSTDVREVFSTEDAFAALRADGSVVTWGQRYAGGDSRAVSDQLVNVEQIFATDEAFAALKSDGSVVTWGYSSLGGDSSAVADELQSGVAQLYSNPVAFAAVKEDGSVVTWGNQYSGGDSSSVETELTNVDRIYATNGAFVALKNDGSVVAWGDSNFGGEAPDNLNEDSNPVQQVFATQRAFAALKADGTVVAWGGSIPNSGGTMPTAVADDLAAVDNAGDAVVSIYATRSAFAALKHDGTVVTWGSNNDGGDSSTVSDQLVNVEHIFATDEAFAALKSDGSVVTWGFEYFGGDSESVSEQLQSGVVGFANIATDDNYTDTFAPYLTAVQRDTPTDAITNNDELIFKIAFDFPVTSIGTDDFALTTTGTASGTIASVSATEGTSVTVTVNSVVGDGELGLAVASGADIRDKANNVILTNTPEDSQTYSIDNTAPVATAITRQGSATPAMSVSTLTFSVSFDSPVANLDTTDFSLAATGSANGNIAAAGTQPGDASQAWVTVTGLSGDGTLGLNIASNNDITDTAGNALTADAPATNEAYILDRTPPTLTAITRQDPATATTGADLLTFRAQFDEAVQGVNASDFTVTGSSATVLGVNPINASTYDLVIGGGDLASYNGAVGLNLASGHGITDLAGNALPDGDPTTDETYTLDNPPPVNAAPEILSGNGATASISIAENTTAVTTIIAHDPEGDPISYSLTGGADQALFAIDASSGALTFKAAPDYENPQDQGDTAGNNTYVVHVQAADDQGGSDAQVVTITVTNVEEGGGGGGGGGSIPTDPTDPPAPTDPTDPTDPSDPGGNEEDQVPPLPGPDGTSVPGDGNGDGVADGEQPDVLSRQILMTDQADEAPTDTEPTFVTLGPGFYDDGTPAGGVARITHLEQHSAPEDTSAYATLPLGLLSFEAQLKPGATTGHFSLLVDATTEADGFYKQTEDGLVNIATAVTPVGDKIRIDFAIEDGGEFDADGARNGRITDPGGPGRLQAQAHGDKLYVDAGASFLEITGDYARVLDFGGTDSYQLAATLSGDVTIVDNQESRIHLPEGLNITGARFCADGLELHLGDASLRLLGAPATFVYVLGDSATDAEAATELDYTQLAELLGTEVPARGTEPSSASATGVIQANGSLAPLPLAEEVGVAPLDTDFDLLL